MPLALVPDRVDVRPTALADRADLREDLRLGGERMELVPAQARVLARPKPRCPARGSLRWRGRSSGPEEAVEPFERRLEDGAFGCVTEPDRSFAARTKRGAGSQADPLLEKQPAAERE
jgi:hypothetical protein